MAINCDPSSLANSASCFSCTVPIGGQLPLQTYLIAQIALNLGAITSADPAVLMSDPNVAKFMQTIPPGLHLAVQNVLLCALVNK